jgi:hypothetical protein
MNKYLLLRDNKQSGPYSMEELVAKGLKAYDLVWLEGRSAAWRYPSEFDELKPYAPVVEEQPFDRFYKKPAAQTAVQDTSSKEQNTSANVQASAQVSQQPVQQKAVPVEENNVTQPVTVKAVETAKHIYVTMPGGKTPVTQKEEPKKEEKVQPVQQQQQATTQQKQSTPVQKSTPAVNNTAKSSYLVSEEDDELNSAMLANHKSQKQENDSFLNDYEARKAAFQSKKSGSGAVKSETPAQKKAEPVAVKKTEAPVVSASRSKKRDLREMFAIPSHFSGSFFQDNKVLVRSLVAAVLILGGVVIGLIINSGKQHAPDSQVLETLVKEIREQQKDKSSTSPAGSESDTDNKRSKQQDEGGNNDNLGHYTEQPPATNNNIATEPNNRQAIIKKDANTTPNKPISVPVSNTTTEEVEAQPAVIDNKEKANQETIEKARRNIYDLVGVEASQFKVGLLGGISELDITISNNSLYTLDQVDVEIKYFGPEKKLVKTQTLKFSHVPPGKQRTLNTPSTRRGITIDYSITGINSKALGMAQAGY